MRYKMLEAPLFVHASLSSLIINRPKMEMMHHFLSRLLLAA